MKKLYQKQNLFLFLTTTGMLLFSITGLYGQVTYSFTTAGATGMNGPSQTQVNTAYGSTNLSGSVTVVNGIQQFTVPQTGGYRLTAIGAQGGDGGGRGAYIAGDFTLTAGTVLKILVGQEGTTGTNGNFSAGGGGGGSFITDMSNVPFVVAGGGGGNGGGYVGPGLPCCLGGMEASLTNDGRGAPSVGGTAGTGGGGGGCISSLNAGGGAGITGDGSLCQAAATAKSYVNGAAGGGPGGGSGQTGEGGFGGGGGGYSSGVGNRGGGGGGYSGGGGGSAVASESEAAGGGGGSFNSGANQTNSISTNSGDGAVYVEFLCDVTAFAVQNPICQGSAVTLSTNAGSNINWSTGGTTNTISVSPASNTSYTVTGTSSSTTGCVASIVVNVSVSPLPSISSVVSPTMLCVGSTATVSHSGASTYTLNGTQTGQSATVNPVVTTVYTVSGHSSFGCLNTKTVAVNVNTNSLTASGDVTICAGEITTLTASGALSYVWTSNGVSADFQQIMVSPPNTTMYEVTGRDVFGCMLTNSVNVEVRSSPVINVSSSEMSPCRGDMVTISATGGDSYTWNQGSGSSFTIVLTADLPYHFIATGVDQFGCEGTGSLSVVAGKCTDLPAYGSLSASVFPNPVHNELNVKFSGAQGGEIRVMDAQGRLILEKTSADATLTVDLGTFSAGVYVIEVRETSGVSRIPLIKQ